MRPPTCSRRLSQDLRRCRSAASQRGRSCCSPPARSTCCSACGARRRRHVRARHRCRASATVLVARLNRFKIRVKAESRARLACIAVRGDESGESWRGARGRPARRPQPPPMRATPSSCWRRIDACGRRWAPRSCPARPSPPRPASPMSRSASPRAATRARSWSSGWTAAARQRRAISRCCRGVRRRAGVGVLRDGAAVGTITSVGGDAGAGLREARRTTALRKTERDGLDSCEELAKNLDRIRVDRAGAAGGDRGADLGHRHQLPGAQEDLLLPRRRRLDLREGRPRRTAGAARRPALSAGAVPGSWRLDRDGPRPTAPSTGTRCAS